MGAFYNGVGGNLSKKEVFAKLDSWCNTYNQRAKITKDRINERFNTIRKDVNKWWRDDAADAFVDQLEARRHYYIDTIDKGVNDFKVTVQKIKAEIEQIDKKNASKIRARLN